MPALRQVSSQSPFAQSVTRLKCSRTNLCKDTGSAPRLSGSSGKLAMRRSLPAATRRHQRSRLVSRPVCFLMQLFGEVAQVPADAAGALAEAGGEVGGGRAVEEAARRGVRRNWWRT
ncbi:hypothetical protein DMH15_00790 [Streptomyces sp. WAC 06725]|nr:hypothetical protein DMH15_00790 [Streptomyces sp. WAC 06725]